MKQPWELTLPAIHKDVLEPFRKRFKVGGNMGPCSITAEHVDENPSQSVDILVPSGQTPSVF